MIYAMVDWVETWFLDGKRHLKLFVIFGRATKKQIEKPIVVAIVQHPQFIDIK